MEQIAIFYQIFKSGSSKKLFKCLQFTKLLGLLLITPFIFYALWLQRAGGLCSCFLPIWYDPGQRWPYGPTTPGILETPSYGLATSDILETLPYGAATPGILETPPYGPAIPGILETPSLMNFLYCLIIEDWVPVFLLSAYLVWPRPNMVLWCGHNQHSGDPFISLMNFFCYFLTEDWVPVFLPSAYLVWPKPKMALWSDHTRHSGDCFYVLV